MCLAGLNGKTKQRIATIARNNRTNSRAFYHRAIRHPFAIVHWKRRRFVLSKSGGHWTGFWWEVDVYARFVDSIEEFGYMLKRVVMDCCLFLSRDWRCLVEGG
jgi:hypothetical protein